jgi:hypothetical protein
MFEDEGALIGRFWPKAEVLAHASNVRFPGVERTFA